MNYLRTILQTYPTIGFRLCAALFLLIVGATTALFGVSAGLIVSVAVGLAGLYIWTYQADRFKRGMLNSPNPIFVVTRTGKVIAWNHASETILGYDQAVVGQHFARLLADSSDAERVQNMLDQVFETGKPVVNIDLRYRTRQGDIHEMISRIYPITDRRGQVHECIVSNTEITERRQMEAALKESEDRFRQIAENVREVFYILDVSSGKLLYISPNFDVLWGKGGASLLDNPFSFLDLLHPDDAEKMQQAFQSAQDHELEFHLNVPTLGPRWMRLRNTFVHDEKTGGLRLIGVVEDVTERKQAAEYVLERERMRILTAFIRDASHEFRTPLSIINTKLYLVEHASDRIYARKLITDINHQVDQIVRLLDSLVLMSQLDSGMAFAREPLDANQVLTDVANQLRPAAEENGQTLTLNLDPALPRLAGDADLLEEAFKNLIDNGLRHTPAGGHITIHTSAGEAQAIIEIRDTGRGIAPEVLPRIFERFYRADDARSLRGFGLGLPIARQIIEGHDGQIEVESTPGQGTCVRVVLPLPNGVMLPSSSPL